MRILLVKSSIRDGRVADKVEVMVREELKNFPDTEISVADFKQMPLPLFDSPVLPSAEGYSPADKNVQAWSKMVSEADAIILLTAEYNHSFTPVIKNAIDWLFKEWSGKPIAFVGYGWVGGARAIAHLRNVFGSLLAARAMESEANLRFTKEINIDGTVIDQDATADAIKTVLEELNLTVNETVAV